MSIDIHSQHKEILKPLREAMYDFNADGVKAGLGNVMQKNVQAHMPWPLGDLEGPDAFYENCYAPLLTALPDLERRDYILMAGNSGEDNNWVGCGGFYCGTFVAPWLDIPPTGHFVHMRYAEFYRFEDEKIVEVQAIWDIPEVMMQADAWPLAPSLGWEGLNPGPATNDGLVEGPYQESRSSESCQHVVDMLGYLKKHPSKGGPEVMQMEEFWHPRMNWYGPAGIGTGRGIAGFRHWHQIPFLSAMPDRGQYVDEIEYHFFGDGDYVAVTGWPNMIQTVTDDGWMGIAPAGKRITMCSLDFWRIENGLIRENWVLVDLLDAYRQLGVDVFARLREFNKARVPGRIPFPIGSE